MKNMLILVLMILALVCPLTTNGQTKEFKFAWKQTLPEPNNIEGWKFYKATASGGPYVILATVYFLEAVYNPVLEEYMSPPIQLDNSEHIDDWWFVATAFDTVGYETSYSIEVHGLLLPPAVINDLSLRDGF